MHRHAVCKEQGQHRIQMFSAATQGFNNPSPHSNHTRCLDTSNSYFSPYSHHKSDMPYGRPMEIIPVQQPLHVLKLPMACSATLANFCLPPGYETPILNVNVSLDWANICAINITTLHFRVWQHMGRNHSDLDLQHLAILPSIPVHQIYDHLLNNSQCLTPFNMKPSGIQTPFGVCSATPEYTFQL